MQNTNKTTWKDIWKKKGNTATNCDQFSLQELIAIDGFDSKAGLIMAPDWLEYVSHVKSRLNICPGQRLLEVGCGAGAFLLPFAVEGVNVCGIDYSEELIDIAKSAVPRGLFKLADANSIPFDNNVFDSVVSNAVFFYFPTYSYAEQSLSEIKRVLKPGGTAAILDVSDLELKDIAEELREREIGVDNYNRLYIAPGLSHLYFSRQWFEHFGLSNGLTVLIEDQCISGYQNSSYRFNVFLTKKS